MAIRRLDVQSATFRSSSDTELHLGSRWPQGNQAACHSDVPVDPNFKAPTCDFPFEGTQATGTACQLGALGYHMDLFRVATPKSCA